MRFRRDERRLKNSWVFWTGILSIIPVIALMADVIFYNDYKYQACLTILIAIWIGYGFILTIQVRLMKFMFKKHRYEFEKNFSYFIAQLTLILFHGISNIPKLLDVMNDSKGNLYGIITFYVSFLDFFAVASGFILIFLKSS